MQSQGRFNRFTGRARKVLSLAQEEAQRFNHNYIGTEHLLLGLVREGEGVGARVLIHLGVDLDRVRVAVEQIIGRGDQIVLGEIGLTPRAKKVIELAVDESRRLNHHYIGTEHLLLGLVREGEGIAAGVLTSLGVDLEKVRTQTIQLLSQSSSSTGKQATLADQLGAATQAGGTFYRDDVPFAPAISARFVREVARALARQQRLALVSDACVLGEGRQLVLAGVSLGESSKGADTLRDDGDVVARAVVMAVLAAANRGEIDDWFPDPHAKSIEHLAAIRRQLIEPEHLLLGTVDITILCDPQLPLRSHFTEMRNNVADGLGIAAEQVHIKGSAISDQDRVEARVLVSLWAGL